MHPCTDATINTLKISHILQFFKERPKQYSRFHSLFLFSFLAGLDIAQIPVTNILSFCGFGPANQIDHIIFRVNFTSMDLI